MTIRAPDVIAPMLAANEVVVLFPPGVASEADPRDLLGGFMFESSDFCLVATAVYVGFSRSVTGLASLMLALPIGLGKTRMRGLREALEYILVAPHTGITANIVIRVLRRTSLRRIRLRERTRHG